MNSTRRRDHLAFILIWVPYALLVYRFWFVCDDAYISFRYAKNWVAGHGLRYNLGNELPVEGFSNFLWVVVAAFIEKTGGDVTIWSNVASFLCGSALLYLVFRSLRYGCGLSLWTATLATASLGLMPPFAVWSTSGLETVPFALLFFISVERLAFRPDKRSIIGTALTGVAVVLIRTEGLGWAMVAAGAAILSKWLSKEKIGRPVMVFASACLITYAGYLAWRYSYYKQPFANTVYAKVSMSPETIVRGAKYVLSFLLTFITPIGVLLGVFKAMRVAPIRLIAPVALIIAANAAYAVAVSGDNMAMARLLIPGVVVFCPFITGWLLEGMSKNATVPKYQIGFTGAAIIFFQLLPCLNHHLLPAGFRAAFTFRSPDEPFMSEFEKWQSMRDNAMYRAQLAPALNRLAKPGDSLVVGAIGSVGYYTNLYIYDMNGLVTPKVAKREVSGPLIMPGHDKHVPYTFFLEDRPTFILATFAPVTIARAAEILERFRLRPESSVYAPYVEQAKNKIDGKDNYVMVFYRRVEPFEEHHRAWEAALKASRPLS